MLGADRFNHAGIIGNAKMPRRHSGDWRRLSAGRTASHVHSMMAPRSAICCIWASVRRRQGRSWRG